MVIYALVSTIGYAILVGMIMICIGVLAVIFHFLKLDFLKRIVVATIRKVSFLKEEEGAPAAWNSLLFPQVLIILAIFCNGFFYSA